MTSLNPILAGPRRPGRTVLCPFPDSVSDAAGWERFVKRYGGFLARCVRRGFRLVSESCLEEDVEDIVQNLYTRLLEDGGRRLHRFRGTTEKELLAYLRRMAFRLVVDLRRQARAEKRGGGISFKMVRALEAQGRTSRDGPLSPEERVLTLEGCRLAIREALPSGTGGARRGLKILHLALVEGRTSREIAQAWGESLQPSSVDSSLHRMRRRLAASSLSWADLQSSA